MSLKDKAQVFRRMELVLDWYIKKAPVLSEKTSTEDLLDGFVKWAKETGLKELRDEGWDI
jgi:hypothetical protein